MIEITVKVKAAMKLQKIIQAAEVRSFLFAVFSVITSKLTGP